MNLCDYVAEIFRLHFIETIYVKSMIYSINRDFQIIKNENTIRTHNLLKKLEHIDSDIELID